MKRFFLAALCLFACHGHADPYQDQIEQIDTQIKELKEMKRGYEARALRAENQADRLQFEDHFVLETRRYYRIADENRAKAAKIQEEIDRLEDKRADLLKKDLQGRDANQLNLFRASSSETPSMRMRLMRDVSPVLNGDLRFGDSQPAGKIFNQLFVGLSFLRNPMNSHLQPIFFPSLDRIFGSIGNHLDDDVNTVTWIASLH